jgi:integrase
VLKQALSQAVHWEELARNPADAVDPPKVEWHPMQTYDFAQTVELLELVRDTPIFIPVLLTGFCGLRRGEICALRWREVRLGKGLSDDDLVTAHEDGSVMAPIYISQRWDRFIREANLPRIRFHVLRHPRSLQHVIPGMQEDLRQWSMMR